MNSKYIKPFQLLQRDEMNLFLLHDIHGLSIGINISWTLTLASIFHQETIHKKTEIEQQLPQRLCKLIVIVSEWVKKDMQDQKSGSQNLPRNFRNHIILNHWIYILKSNLTWPTKLTTRFFIHLLLWFTIYSYSFSGKGQWLDAHRDAASMAKKCFDSLAEPLLHLCYKVIA